MQVWLWHLLVKKRLEDNHLIALFDKAHERTEHSFSNQQAYTTGKPYAITFISTSGDRHLSVRVQSTSKGLGVRFRNSLLKMRTTLQLSARILSFLSPAYIYLGGGVLVAFHAVQSLLRSVQGELGGIVATGSKVNTYSSHLIQKLTRNPGPC